MTKNELLERVYTILAAAVMDPGFGREYRRAVEEALELLYKLTTGELGVTDEPSA